MSDIQSLRSSQDEQKSLKEPQEGRWTDRQNAAYIVFLQLNSKIFRRKQKRRVHKFYQKMSNLIKTRTPVQCRSHHQKLQSKYLYSNRIISKYKENQDLSAYQEQKAKCAVFGLQNPEKAEKLQNGIQRGQFSIQTELQGTDMQFMRYQDYLRLQNSGKEWTNGVHNWNYMFPYHYPSCIPGTWNTQGECKLQEEGFDYGYLRPEKNPDYRRHL